MSYSYHFLLLLCLSVHAYSARPLGLNDKEKDRLACLFTKDVEIEKLQKASIQLESRPSISEELKTQGHQEVEFNERKCHDGWDGAIALKQKDSNAFWKEDEATRGATSGHKIIVSSQNDLLRAAKIEGMKREEERSLLGSSPNDSEEAVDSKENDIMEDVVVMDYAQPHRKPPIHNEKP